MDTQSNKTIRPLLWVAGIAIILFGGAGTAALMGWIPVSTGGSPAIAPVAAEKPSATAIVNGVPVPRARSSNSSNSSNSSSSSIESRAAPLAATGNAPMPTKCLDCGVIESTREVATRGQTTGLGAVGGAVVGGVIGNQVGSGRGQDIATVVGAVGGVIAGNEIEKRVKSTKSYEITVRLEDGSSRVVPQASVPSWRAGDRVRIVDGSIRAN